jgi:hypothetical protein
VRCFALTRCKGKYKKNTAVIYRNLELTKPADHQDALHGKPIDGRRYVIYNYICLFVFKKNLIQLLFSITLKVLLL